MFSWQESSAQVHSPWHMCSPIQLPAHHLVEEGDGVMLLSMCYSWQSSPLSSLGHSPQEAAMWRPQLTGSCSQGNPPSQTSSPNEVHVQDDEQLFDPKMKRLFSLCFVFSTFGSRHLPSVRRMSKDLREELVRAEALGRRVKTCDFSFRLHDFIVRKFEYSVGFGVEYSVEINFGFLFRIYFLGGMGGHLVSTVS